MKNLRDIVNEKLSMSQYRPYSKTKRDPRAEAWLTAFWERIKSMPGAEVSRNNYRIYFPFKISESDLDLGSQQSSYSNNASADLRDSIESILKKKGYIVKKVDYIHGKFWYEIQTQRGPKLREANIGKAIKDDKDLLDQFAADPVRLTANLDGKNMMIVLSNHSYDIAGMSTNRKWTSCMNILDGPKRDFVLEDIKWGTVVAYLIDKDDKNINNPLGRILIKPYISDTGEIVYYPEPTVYSPYVGLDSVREFLAEMCEKISGGMTYLYKIARNKKDPTNAVPETPPEYGLSDEDREFLKKMDSDMFDDIDEEEWEEILRDNEKMYNYLLYYDDMFAKNKGWTGSKKPDYPRSRKRHYIK